MSNRIVGIPTKVAEEVRQSMVSPKYGFPAYKEVAGDGAPCRHCLRLITPGRQEAILFTYDRFAGVEEFPQPGPIYIHADPCERYDEYAAFPEDLRNSPRTLEAYGRGRRLLAQERVCNGAFEPAIAELFSNEAVDYIQVQSTSAGCFTFRIERGEI
jgi:hypothetical protein